MSTLPPEPEAPQFYGKPLKFYAKSHRYKWDTQWVPSVTTIIGRLGKGDALTQWAANCAVDYVRDNLIQYPDNILMAKENIAILLETARKRWNVVREEAAEVGTRVHLYARKILEGQIPSEPLDEPSRKAIAGFWRWVEAHKIEPKAIERRVMSRRHLYAGTCDFYGLIDGRLSVLDFKTGNGVYDEAWWQTSAYDLALREELYNGGPVAAVRWIIHLNKTTGEMTAHCRDTPEDYDRDMEVWLSLLSLDKALRAARPHAKKAA